MSEGCFTTRLEISSGITVMSAESGGLHTDGLACFCDSDV